MKTHLIRLTLAVRSGYPTPEATGEAIADILRDNPPANVDGCVCMVETRESSREVVAATEALIDAERADADRAMTEGASLFTMGGRRHVDA